MATRLQTSFGFVRVSIIGLGLALSVVTGFESTGAQKKDTSAAGTSQVLMCEGLGGSATVSENRTPGGGLISTSVRCSGGMADGLSCTNNQSGSDCSFKTAAPKGSKRPSIADIEAGTVNLADYGIVLSPAP